MPRRNRRSGAEQPRDLSRLVDVGVRVESYAGQRWNVRSVRGNDAGRSYVCPGCQHAISSAQPHVVAWPAEGLGDLSDRRHWHTPCWSARDRRPPRGSWR
ncbi:hypothetical protein IEE94_02320 [Yimella sp. cx-573]|nr:hypothetical protein [Yimella sp. cx-573]